MVKMCIPSILAFDGQGGMYQELLVEKERVVLTWELRGSGPQTRELSPPTDLS